MKKFFIKKISDYCSRLLNTVVHVVGSGNNSILINSWMQLRFSTAKCRNWGDELNFYLLKDLTQKNIANYIDCIGAYTKHKKNYLVIGSIIEEFVNHNSIIWGAGAIEGKKILKEKPLCVCAVRGILTRNYLLSQGVSCPEVFGDPALLLPLIYLPNVRKKYKIGVIPHHSDLNNPIIDKYRNNNFHIIDLTSYSNWHDIIDEINSCEAIISSSLHGLIVADAYRVPNLWMTIGGNLIGGNFKFIDYFSSVNRHDLEPFVISDDMTQVDFQKALMSYKYIKFDPKPLIEAAPWKFKILNPNYYAET